MEQEVQAEKTDDASGDIAQRGGPLFLGRRKSRSRKGRTKKTKIAIL